MMIGLGIGIGFPTTDTRGEAPSVGLTAAPAVSVLRLEAPSVSLTATPSVAVVPASPVQWLRGGLGVTVSGGAMTAWADQAGGHNPVPLSSGTRPHVSAGDVQFVSSDPDSLLNSPYIPASGAITIGIRFRLSTTPGAGAFYSALTFEQTATKTYFELLFSNLGGAYKPYTFGGLVGSTTSVGIADVLDTSAHRLIVTYNGNTNSTTANYTAMLDGVAKTIVASGALARVSTDQGSIGSRISVGGGTSSPYNGFLPEILVYNRALSAGDIAVLDAYLASQPTA